MIKNIINNNNKKSFYNREIILFIIDPQNDFHPGYNEATLPVPNADKDSENISSFIHKHIDKINNIIITLDSHQKIHIAHSNFWKNKPEPFTIISHKDVIEKKYEPYGMIDNVTNYVLNYTSLLEKNNKYKLRIWPDHCIIGSMGHNIVSNIQEATTKWGEEKKKLIHYIYKGSNMLTEHYSALKAEVEIKEDPQTMLNNELINELTTYYIKDSNTNETINNLPLIVVCGQALSHCVNYTIRDLIDNWPISINHKNKMIIPIKNLVILTDCSSSVIGFEKEGKDFLVDMKAKGVTLAVTSDFM